MADITTVSALLTSATSALEIAKIIKNSDHTLKDSEQKLKLADLIETLADVKVQTAEIKQVLIEKDQEISELKQKLSIEQELEYDAPYYWRKKDDQKDGPFCQRCVDSDKKLIRLQGGNRDVWQCKSCSNTFYGKNYSPPQLKQRKSNGPHSWLGN